MKKALISVSIVFNILCLGYYLKRFLPINQGQLKNVQSYFVNRDALLSSLSINKDDIVLVGDSHTNNFECAEIFGSLLFKNRGIFYDTSEGVLKRYRSFTIGQPIAIFLEIGVNDLQNGRSPSEINHTISQLLDSIHALSPSTQVYIQSILPVGLSIASKNSFDNRRLELNNNLRLSVPQKSGIFIDLEPYFANHHRLKSTYDSGDNIHLNYLGYQLWKRIISENLSIKTSPNSVNE